MHPCQRCGQALENHIKVCPRCEHARTSSVGISRETEFSVDYYEEPDEFTDWEWSYAAFGLIFAMVLPVVLGALAGGGTGLMFGTAFAIVAFLLFNVATSGLFG